MADVLQTIKNELTLEKNPDCGDKNPWSKNTQGCFPAQGTDKVLSRGNRRKCDSV